MFTNTVVCRTPILLGAWISALWLCRTTYGQVAPLTPMPLHQLDASGHRQSATPLGAAAELLADVQLYDAQWRDDIAPLTVAFPKDSLRALVVARANAWRDALAARRTVQAMRGRQLEPAAQLALLCGDTVAAQRDLSDRLTMRGLSSAERAYTLSLSVIAFANREHPEWIPIAERYLTQLTALGADGMGRQFLAQRHLATVYHDIGRATPALTHGMAAFALLPNMPFEYRMLGDDQGFYLTMAELLLGTPEATRTLRDLDTLLQTAFRPSAERVAMDPRLPSVSAPMGRDMRAASALAAMLGTPAPVILGSVWINTPDTAMHAQRLDTGTISILDFFSPADAPGLAAQLALAHLPTRFAHEVHLIGIAQLEGNWGVQFISPQDEVQRWTPILRQLAFPITFWAQPKVKNHDGGFKPPENPNVMAYHLDGIRAARKLIVVDRQGRVRRVFLSSGVDQDIEARVAEYITTLLHERSGTTPARPTS